MSSSAILVLSSSSAAIQTRCFLSPVGVAKEYRRCNLDGDRTDQEGACSSLQALRLQTGKLDGFIRRKRSTTAANAGLGRLSGAVHGNSKGNSRSRRKAPVAQDYGEEGDEHQDGKSGSDRAPTSQNQEDQSEEYTASAEECEAFAAAEGILSKDRSSDDESQRLSYTRYLLELGVSPMPREKDSKPEQHTREVIADYYGIEDYSSSDGSVQLSERGNSQDNGAGLQASNESGGEDDLGYGETKELDSKRARDPKSGRGNLPNASDLVTQSEEKSENENIFVHKTAPVDATAFLAPEPKSSSASVVEAKLLGYDADNTDRIAGKENAGELRSGSNGGPVKKKRRKKSKSKAVVESALKVDERGDIDRVRASSGEAERPAIPSDTKFPSINRSATASNEVGNFEPKLDFGTVEVTDVKSASKFSPVAESTTKDSQSPIAVVRVVDSSSALDTSNEDDSPHAPLTVLGKVGSQVVETVLEQAVQTAAKVVPVEIVEQAAQVASKVVELPVVVAEQAAQVGVQVVEILPDVVTEQVGQALDQASDLAEQVVNVVDHVSDVAEQVANTVNEQVSEQVGQVVEQVGDFADQVGQVVEHVSDVAELVANTVNEQVEQVADSVSSTASQVVDHVSDVAEQVANTVNEQVEQVAESVSSTASQVVDHVSDVAEQVANTVNEQVEQVAESVSSTASQVVEQVTEFFTSDEDDDTDSDDEFEAYQTSDLPEFRGKAGLDNFIVRQENQGIRTKIYDIYTYMLKQSFPQFAAAMFSAPILVSGLFTLLYLPEFEGLAFDNTARDFFGEAGGDSLTLHISWTTLFQVFMFSLSLSTGLQPELAPLSPYTLIVANLNALVAQLVFVFLSGAVFARLSQPSQPLRCSAVALVSTSRAQRRRKENAIKVFMARYVLAGPQPCELVDVKIDLTYKYNTLTRTGSFFRATQSLKLVRPEIAFLTHGMLVRHVIDETSPLYQRTPEMLSKEDAIFCLSVVGLERASMQSVFHVQHYCVVDKDVIWDAEFEDIILINKKNRRVVDHSRLSMWKPLTS